MMSQFFSSYFKRCHLSKYGAGLMTHRMAAAYGVVPSCVINRSSPYSILKQCGISQEATTAERTLSDARSASGHSMERSRAYSINLHHKIPIQDARSRAFTASSSQNFGDTPLPTVTPQSKIFLQIVLGIIVTGVFYKLLVEWRRRVCLNRIVKRFEEIHPAEIPPSDYVHRESLEILVRTYLTQVTGKFVCIVSPAAFGKSVLAKEVIYELKEEDFPALLLKADSDGLFSLRHKLGIDAFSEWILGGDFHTVKHLLKDASRILHKKHNKDPILLIDHCDTWLTTEENRILLSHMLELAQEQCDEKGLKIGFVSDTRTSRILETNPGITPRMVSVYVDEFSVKEAKQFLLKQDPELSEQEIRNILEICGGVPHFLRSFRYPDSVLDTMYRRLSTTNLLLEEGEMLKELTQTLLRTPGEQIPLQDILSITKSPENYRLLLENHILRCDNDQTVSFHDSATKNYFIRLFHLK